MPDLQVLRLSDTLLGFYEGRATAASDPRPGNWVEDGALSLGICSFALVDGDEAVVYDTHVSVDRARLIRETVELLGARRIRVVLSHSHLDHIAGTEAFADCEIIANRLTAEQLEHDRAAIEAGTLDGPPAIAPLVMPTTLFDDRLELEVGRLRIELLRFEIHSADATVVHLPDEQLLLAGDTLEDTVTYVSDAGRLERHLDELDRLRQLGATRIQPNHGSRRRIELGGYDATLIDATGTYVRDLLARAGEPPEETRDLRAFIATELAAGSLEYFAPYERVHLANLEAVAAR